MIVTINSKVHYIIVGEFKGSGNNTGGWLCRNCKTGNVFNE